MKILMSEHPGCFALDFEAETMAEAALLVRFGMNRTSQITSHGVAVAHDGSFAGHLVFAKSKRAANVIPARR